MLIADNIIYKSGDTNSNSIINIVTKARDENLKMSEKSFDENKTSPLLKTKEKDFQQSHYKLAKFKNNKILPQLCKLAKIINFKRID